MRRQSRNGQRGVTLIELMIALTILLIAVAGFWSAVVQSVLSTGVGHRRTVQTWLRTDSVDRAKPQPLTNFCLFVNEFMQFCA